MDLTQLESLAEKWPQAQDFVINAATALVIFIVGWIASKWISGMFGRLLEKRNVDKALTRFLASLVQYLVLALTAIAALDRAGVPSTSFVALIGSAGLAIGLAMQGTLGHFASGVMLLIFRPFTLDDVVTVAGQTGVVTEIGLFGTTLVTPVNETIIVPNGSITGSTIVNLTRGGHRRAKIGIGAAYGCDVEKVSAILLKAAQGCDKVLKDPAPAVALTGLGASSVDFTVLVSAKNEDFIPFQGDVRKALYDALNEAGVEIPFNQIVVHQAPAS